MLSSLTVRLPVSFAMASTMASTSTSLQNCCEQAWFLPQAFISRAHVTVSAAAFKTPLQACQRRLHGNDSMLHVHQGMKEVYQTKFRLFHKDTDFSFAPYLPILGTGAALLARPICCHSLLSITKRCVQMQARVKSRSHGSITA